ncbi:MAG: hypothetical protein HWQ35_00005 [Nostoc sp. NMS1]|uniref:hypothetical protein n=1 Tax=unclassified Nostoc TaxID=2593658 RepID=UPI0025FD8497|nr:MULTISPECIES: hypothetical protein [unclassified Nostoc]MBN3905013.1 hypothetical protein [Nostoc sp. NMS1]MBN3991904.1 hypothetical protein [Nostoc sp. NMS2]
MVAGFLFDPKEQICELAALTLGESRLEEAFDLLRICLMHRMIGAIASRTIAPIAKITLPIKSTTPLEPIVGVEENHTRHRLAALQQQVPVDEHSSTLPIATTEK